MSNVFLDVDLLLKSICGYYDPVVSQCLINQKPCDQDCHCARVIIPRLLIHDLHLSFCGLWLNYNGGHMCSVCGFVDREYYDRPDLLPEYCCRCGSKNILDVI